MSKKFFTNLMEWARADEPTPTLGDKRFNLIFILTLKLNGERRWWGWHMVEEEAVNGVFCMEGGCFDVIRFEAKRWIRDEEIS